MPSRTMKRGAREPELVFLPHGIRRKNPRGKLTTPQQVAKIISLFCHDGGEWISGGIINADGGEDIVSFVGQGEPENDSLKNYLN